MQGDVQHGAIENWGQSSNRACGYIFPAVWCMPTHSKCSCLGRAAWCVWQPCPVKLISRMLQVWVVLVTTFTKHESLGGYLKDHVYCTNPHNAQDPHAET